MGVWAFDYFILDAPYSKINLSTMNYNLKNGFEWDNDQLSTNLFSHPYHGSIYYNAGRANGYNFWQSGGFALAGSAMWELFMENEVPSINDIIATPIGGMALGEVFYRASDMILDDRSVGWARFGREFAALVVNPSRGISRILTGDAWRKRGTSGRQFGLPTLSLSISSGVRTLELTDNIFDKGVGSATDIAIEYGDKFDHDQVAPYDYFCLKANLNFHQSQPIIGQVNIIGRLWGGAVETKKHFIGYGVYQHFDYYDSDTISNVSAKIPYKMGVPASFGVGYYHMWKTRSKWSFNSYGHFNGILLGASLSDYYLVDKRNYNLSSGFGWKFGINFAFSDRIGISGLYEGYRLYTHKGYPEGYDLSMALENRLNSQGDKSDAMLHVTNLLMDIKLYKKLYLTLSFSAYRRSTHYAHYDDVFSLTTDSRLMLTYKF